jgi:hypothetical protein
VAADAVGGRTPASSRESDVGAGWSCTAGSFVDRLPGSAARPLSWFSGRVLWETRNDVLAKWLGDPTNETRRGWLTGVPPEATRLDLTRLDDFSFLLLGDTGEGDRSQYALVPPLLAQAEGTEFLFLCSDVLYPAGDANDYVEKFYLPYRSYPGSIYAIPGNHDWYDGLEGFMRHLCGVEPQLHRDRDPPLSRAAVRGMLWRRPLPFDADRFADWPAREQDPRQRTPYFTIDTQRLRLVGIDTGITKDLDAEQARWLLQVSRESPLPKVLLTGTPIYVNGRRQELELEERVEDFDTVDSIVRHPAHGYVAAIGGDIHNYQRYPVRTEGRTIQYIVSGGGGAFMHATHTIEPIDPRAAGGVTEEEFKCYPLRRDSLAAFSRMFDRRLGRLRRGGPLLELTPTQAALYLREYYAGRGELNLGRPLDDEARLETGTRRAARATLLMPAEHGFHKWLSPFFDWDDPPFFKNFLRLDVRAGELDVTCYGVRGCVCDDHEGAAVEDRVTIPLR